MMNTKAMGNTVPGWITTYDGIDTPEECQKLCQNAFENGGDCQYFVLNQNSNTCNLKTEEARNNLESAQDFVFGKRVC